MELTIQQQDAATLSWHNIRTFLKGQPPIVWLVGGWLVLAAQIISPLWYPTYDASRYVSIARSVAKGEYVTSLGSPHLNYGVGYPLLISPVFLVATNPFYLVSGLNAVFAALYLAGAYFWARRYAPEGAVLLALLSVANVIVLSIFRRPLSETAFMAVMVWAVNALSAIPRSRKAWCPVLLAAILVSLLVVIRQVGILFVGGFAWHLAILAWRREMSWLRAALLTAAVGLPSTMAVAAMISYDNETAAQARDWTNFDIFARSKAAPRTEYPEQPLIPQCLEGLRLRCSEVGRLIVPGMFGAYGVSGDWLNVNLLVYWPICGLVLAGWWQLARRSDIFALTAPLYAGLYIYWPFDQSGRFFAPLLPLLAVSLWLALARLGRKRLALAGGLLALHATIALGYWLAVERCRALADDRHWAPLEQVAQIIRADPGPVSVGSDLGRTQFFLEYLLDRPVACPQHGQPIRADVRWLVSARDGRQEPGFQVVAAAGPFMLLQR
jgi:hypothetical protein